MIRTLAVSALMYCALSPAAFASCDISQTKCALNGGKCNIHFKNKTGEAKGSSGGTDLSQETAAHIVRVKALNDDGDRVGNALTIDAGAKNTMNLDRKAKKDFAKIRISSIGRLGVESVSLGCESVKAVLNGSGTCKIFYGYGPNNYGVKTHQLGYSCDGGNVVAPKR